MYDFLRLYLVCSILSLARSYDHIILALSRSLSLCLMHESNRRVSLWQFCETIQIKLCSLCQNVSNHRARSNVRRHCKPSIRQGPCCTRYAGDCRNPGYCTMVCGPCQVCRVDRFKWIMWWLYAQCLLSGTDSGNTQSDSRTDLVVGLTARP